MEKPYDPFSKQLWEDALDFYQNAIEQGYSVSFENLQKKLGISERLARTVRTMLTNQDIISQTHAVPDKKIAKRVLLTGDFHCGHFAGLTPHGYQVNENHPTLAIFAQFQRETWTWFENTINRLKPFHAAIYNGDLIDGRGDRSGSTELITSDRHEQADMAKHIIRMVHAKKNYITYGTPYHTGNSEDFETGIANSFGAAIGGELNISVDGVILNIKHKTGGSQALGGVATAPLKATYWSELWAEKEKRPKADYVIRSHTHHYVNVEMSDRHVIVLPALQGAMTKFGERQMDKIVDYGFGYLDIFQDGSHQFTPVFYVPEAQKKTLHIA